MKIFSLLFFFVFSSCYANALHSRESHSMNTRFFKDTTIKILWQENTCKNCQPVRRINQQYLTSAPDAQKAALGLVSTYYASVCDDVMYQPAKPRILSCELSKALGFDHQCSEAQLRFLNHWFRKDSLVLRRLTFDSCNMKPPGSNSPTSFTAITIKAGKNSIEIICSLVHFSTQQEVSWFWDEHLFFELSPDNYFLYLIKTKVKNSYKKTYHLGGEGR
jgi:hypothetical protein